MKRLFARHRRRILGSLLVVHAVLLAYSAAIHTPVIDEPAHVAAGLGHWQFGDFSLYRVNPPLVRLVATAPLLLTNISHDGRFYTRYVGDRREHSVGDEIIDANGSHIFRYMTIARWACIPFSLVGAIACYTGARLLFGRMAGVAAAALWCFSPTILGHGSLFTPDVAGTAMGLAACLVFARWLVAPTLSLALLAGGLLAIAEATKSTWIILFPLYVVIWMAWRLSATKSDRRPRAGQLATMLFLGWLGLSASYGFSGIGSPFKTIQFRSQLFGTMFCQPDGRGGTELRPWVAEIPIPLPCDYVIGLDRQYKDLESPNRNYLRGRWRTGGWWYYYLYGLTVKETCGTLVLAGLSLLAWGVALFRRKTAQRISRRRRAHLAAGLLVAFCPLTVLAVASASTGMNHHVRYVIPVVPYLYILGAGLLSRGLPWPMLRHSASVLLVTFAVASSLVFYPHSLSYFNELAGGPTGGVYHLNNSNIDWGQDLLLLRNWKRKHLPDEAINLAYFGRVDPKYAGIDYRLAPMRSRGESAIGPSLEPGWYAVSVTFLQGRGYIVRHPVQGWVECDEDAFGYFRKLTPAGRVGYSIYVFQIE